MTTRQTTLEEIALELDSQNETFRSLVDEAAANADLLDAAVPASFVQELEELEDPLPGARSASGFPIQNLLIRA